MIIVGQSRKLGALKLSSDRLGFLLQFRTLSILLVED